MKEIETMTHERLTKAQAAKAIADYVKSIGGQATTQQQRETLEVLNREYVSALYGDTATQEAIEVENSTIPQYAYIENLDRQSNHAIAMPKATNLPKKHGISDEYIQAMQQYKKPRKHAGQAPAKVTAKDIPIILEEIAQRDEVALDEVTEVVKHVKNYSKEQLAVYAKASEYQRARKGKAWLKLMLPSYTNSIKRRLIGKKFTIDYALLPDFNQQVALEIMDLAAHFKPIVLKRDELQPDGSIKKCKLSFDTFESVPSELLYVVLVARATDRLIPWLISQSSINGMLLLDDMVQAANEQEGEQIRLIDTIADKLQHSTTINYEYLSGLLNKAEMTMLANILQGKHKAANGNTYKNLKAKIKDSLLTPEELVDALPLVSTYNVDKLKGNDSLLEYEAKQSALYKQNIQLAKIIRKLA
jgi:hypothetical protein